MQSASRRETRRGVSAACILEGDSEGQVCSLEGAEGRLGGTGLRPGGSGRETWGKGLQPGGKQKGVLPGEEDGRVQITRERNGAEETRC